MSTPEHGERKHHPYSPSSLKSFAQCPSFGKKDGTNAAAERGTLMHEASDSGDFSKLTERETEAVLFYLGVIEEAKERMPGCTELIEVKVAIDDNDTTSGYLDRALISADKRRAYVGDLKTGMGHIEPASTNKQGIAYALGILRDVPTLEEIEVEFILPFQYPRTDSHVFTRADLRKYYDELVMIVSDAMKADKLPADDWSMARPHQGLCRFCSKLDDCPKATGILSDMGKSLPVAHIEPTAMMATTDPEEMGRVLDNLKFMEDFMKNVRNRITEMAKLGTVPDGYALVEVAEREVVNDEAVASVLLEQLKLSGMTDDEAFEKTKSAFTIKVSVAEGIVSDNALRGQKKAAKDALREALLSAGAMQYGKPKVWLKRTSVKADPKVAALEGDWL